MGRYIHDLPDWPEFAWNHEFILARDAASGRSTSYSLTAA